MSQPTLSAPLGISYRTIAVEGVNIFYREAGPADGPVVLLLHGWPSSSHMFRDLIPKLADRFHLAGAEAIARDNPNATVMLVDGGHFALEAFSSEIAAAMHALADRVAAETYRA